MLCTFPEPCLHKRTSIFVYLVALLFSFLVSSCLLNCHNSFVKLCRNYTASGSKHVRLKMPPLLLLRKKKKEHALITQHLKTLLSHRLDSSDRSCRMMPGFELRDASRTLSSPPVLQLRESFHGQTETKKEEEEEFFDEQRQMCTCSGLARIFLTR